MNKGIHTSVHTFCFLIFLLKYALSYETLSELKQIHKCPDFETGDGELNLTGLWTVPQDLMTDSSDNTSFRLISPTEFSCFSLTTEVTMFMFPEPSEVEITDPILSNNYSTINGSDNLTVSSNSTGYQEYQDYSNQIRFTSRGILKNGNEYFRPDEYCIQRIHETRVSVRVCEINCQDELTPCVPICCSLDKAMLMMNVSKSSCRPSERQYKPTFYDAEGSRVSPEVSETIRPHFYQKIPACPLFHYSLKDLQGSAKAPFRLLRNGKVRYAGKERRWMNWEDFCLTGLLQDKNDGQGIVYSEKEEDQLLFTCWPEDTYPSDEKKAVKMTLYISAFIPGSFFLFITILVYILLWEKQNIHGWTILSFVSSMFFLFVFMTWNCFIGLYYNDETLKTFEEPHKRSSFLCTCIGVIVHFFFLSIFTWLSVINFDLWWTFKSMAPVAGRSKGIKRFICYLTFAWGVPTIVVLVGISLQNLYPDPESEVMVPQYGTAECHLIAAARGVYLYYIIGILLAFNLIFMGLTFYTIYKFKEGTRAVDTARSNNSQNLSLKLFFKLFVVMGVTWIFEFVAWLNEAQYIVWYYFILDLLNLLQSIWICFIFVCKRKILNQLEQKYPKMKVITGPLKKITVSRRATRSITTMDGTRTTGFSGRKSTATSSNRNI